VSASEAAFGRLHEATGRTVLTATAEGKPAFEGYEGHGVFTWSLLDALRHGDRNGNGTIELSELVAHAQDQVPKNSAKLNGRGLVAIGMIGPMTAIGTPRRFVVLRNSVRCLGPADASPAYHPCVQLPQS
jgi:hypothetical protein